MDFLREGRRNPIEHKMSNTETHLLSMLLDKKPRLFAPDDAPVVQWKECWNMLIYQIPTMWKLKEEWVYYHRTAKKMMCGKDAQVQQEFQSLQTQGLFPTDNTAINEKHVFAILPHPKKKKMGLRAEFEFQRFLGKEEEGEEVKGQGLCPILWGLGAMADGITYVHVKITEVELSKDDIKGSFDLINGKFGLAK